MYTKNTKKPQIYAKETVPKREIIKYKSATVLRKWLNDVERGKGLCKGSYLQCGDRKKQAGLDKEYVKYDKGHKLNYKRIKSILKMAIDAKRDPIGYKRRDCEPPLIAAANAPVEPHHYTRGKTMPEKKKVIENRNVGQPTKRNKDSRSG